MTTESKQVRRDSGTTVLLGAAATATLLGLLLALVGGLVEGRGAALGALVGTLVVVVVMTVGSLAVNVVATVMPAMSLLVALMTYLLQLVALFVVFSALDRSGQLGEDLRRGWISGAVIAGTLVWMAAQVRLATTRRIAVYDLPDQPSPTLVGAASTPEAGAR